MGSRVILSIVSASAILASVYSAVAADIIPEPPVVELPPVEKFGGWYLRGDIGYAKSYVDGVSYFQGPTMTGAFEVHDFDDSWMIGGGIGYQINDWFRVDWTANYYGEMDFTGSSAQNVVCVNVVAVGTCSYSDNGSFSATTLLANAYFDLGNYQGFTPYVGFGIGGAYVNWGTLTNTEYEDANNANSWSDTHSGNSGWRFAYALHAGASYDFSAHLKLDAGYTFTNITGGGMFGFGSTSGLVGTQGYNDDIQIHAFKLGLRYQIW